MGSRPPRKCFLPAREPDGAKPLIQRTQRTVVRQGKSYKIQPETQEINMSMQVFPKKQPDRPVIHPFFAFLRFFLL